MAEAVLALGGNVGDARATIAAAIEKLCDESRTRLIARSSDYATPPWGDPDQPDFVNACVIVETSLTPRELLARAHEVERALGRDRATGRRYGPRPIDVDVIDYEGVALDEPGLHLPHPRVFERAFVLVPLCEIAPNRVIGKTRVEDAVAHVEQIAILRLPDVPT